MKKEKTFHNPILSGFYPDPSICRVGEDYYMVTSSFVYYPGLPVFHSKDLVHWEQIGHCIHRTDQLDYKNCETSLGLWAPTIRYHEGIFYVINTFVSEGREAKRENYIVTAQNPAGPWSNPIFIEGADGIDPSLFFDDDGKVWYTGNFISRECLYEGHHGIYLCELDSEGFQIIGEKHFIWDGKISRGKWLEAPHIYKKDGWYYLMAAEGGTFTNHSVMMARSRRIDGEYEVCPRNPIVTHRHLSLMHEIAVVGHGDIVETQEGEWWMVLLGVRPYEGFHFNLGRETFLVPIEWQEDGWPLLETENGLVNERERLPKLQRTVFPPQPLGDNFEEPELGMIWNTVHPPVVPFYSLTEKRGYLRLYLKKEVLHEIGTPAYIGRRQQHKAFLAVAAMDFQPGGEGEEAGIAALQDDRFHYSLVKTLNGGRAVVRLYQTEGAVRKLVEEAEIEAEAGIGADAASDRRADRLYLAVQGERDFYQFYYGFRERERRPIGGQMPGALLSSNTNEGFTGTYLGMYASSNGMETENYADFDWFQYWGMEE